MILAVSSIGVHRRHFQSADTLSLLWYLQDHPGKLLKTIHLSVQRVKANRGAFDETLAAVYLPHL